MKTTVKSYGRDQSLEVSHEPGDCPYCEAGRSVKWIEPGNVVFFETGEPDTLRRVELVHMGPPLAMLCQDVSRSTADRQIATLYSSLVKG